MAYTLTFWGTRGSIPTPGPQTARYGGNTPCVAVHREDAGGDRLVIMDAGTGIRLLGKDLVQSGNGPLQLDLLVTHTHWDHIQGLPFFAPFFGEGNTVRIWGAKQGDVGLDQVLRQQMHPVVFPVPLDRVAANLTVEHVTPGEFEVDGFHVTAFRVRHPGTTLGFRLTPVDGGSSLAYVPDNELGRGGDYGVGRAWHEDFVRFLQGVDVLIHDAMYSEEEVDRYRGWGHSSHREAVGLAERAGVRRLVLFHHSPDHDDDAMDALVEDARRATEGSLEVVAAVEGLQLTL